MTTTTDSSLPATLPTHGGFLRRLTAFLSLDAPYLLPYVIPDEAAPEMLEVLLARSRWLVDQQVHADAPIQPGLTQGSSREAFRSDLEIALRGFFRREEHREALTAGDRRRMHRTMRLTRALDDHLKAAFDRKEIVWGDYPSPQKGFRSRGQEAIVGAALPLRRPPAHAAGPDYDGDVIAPLIRDLGALLMFRPEPLHAMLVQYGKSETPVGGRDLHLGDLDWGILPPAAPLAIATQTTIGLAHAFQRRGEDRVAVSFIGDGGASLGEWHEAVNFAAARSLAVVFVIQNNQWALGTHVSEQTATRRFALRAAGYGIPGATLFGNDPDEVAAGMAWATERARAGHGPVLLELVTYRRPGHAHHDDDRFHGNPDAKIPGYEVPEEREAWETMDPVDAYESLLLAEGVLTQSGLDAVHESVRAEIAEAAEQAAAAPWPEPSEYRSMVVAPFEPEPPAPVDDTRRMAYDEAVREGLAAAMDDDDRVFVIGEDVGGRYGGAFGVTRGLAKRFGDDRCVNTPLAESAIVGCAVGAAIEGLRPVVEMQFADFLACGFNALVNNAAKLHWRWGRPVPLVVRLPYGGATGDLSKLLGGGPFHSQCPEMWFVRTPGWKVVAPSTPADAKGLLLSAIADPNPVIFLEAKGLYGFFRTDLREEVPTGMTGQVPIGEATVRREGDQVTILSYGSMVWASLAAAERLADEGISAAVVDLRSLWPLDMETIARSVRSTHRAVIVHEDTLRGGFGGELAARIADECFWDLDAPIRRVAAPDTPVPYAPPLEHDYLPKADGIAAACRELVSV